ncbi:MAG: hypothetical protein FD135_573 [Comamonadaceae bacterium]|nr:MAG: hypothetical protein FD135_573 [Comamonadaceae bacterium]
MQVLIHLAGHLRENGVGQITRIVDGHTLTVARDHLAGTEPAVRLPDTGAQQHGNQQHALLFLALEQRGHFFLDAKVRGQKVR